MSNSSIEFKAMPGQFNVDEAQGIVECFVAGIGNKDSVGDVLIAGAFSKSLTRRKPRVVWGHNWNDPIGKVLEIYEVPPGDRRLPQKMLNAGIGGLYAKVQFNLNSEKGREAFANVAFFGQEQEWSIGYKTLDAIFDPNIQANVLKEVELYEVSPVLHGANQLTGTISVYYV
jgi:HK97 family phage prohead protease